MRQKTKAELIQELETTKEIARLFYHWALWLDHEMNAAFCVCSMEELEEVNKKGLKEYEEWRKVRESGLRNQHE